MFSIVYVLVREHYCFSTQGSGRFFVPIALIDHLSKTTGEANIDYVIKSPDLPPMPEQPMSFATNRSGIVEERMSFWYWYWKKVIEALKPIDDYIQEGYVK